MGTKAGSGFSRGTRPKAAVHSRPASARVYSADIKKATSTKGKEIKPATRLYGLPKRGKPDPQDFDKEPEPIKVKRASSWSKR